MNEILLGDVPERYLAALRAHLADQTTPGVDEGVTEMWHKAAALDLDILEMAKIHQTALAAILPADGSPDLVSGMTKRAAQFFIEAVRSIEESQPEAMVGSERLKRLATALDQRTRELKESRRELEEGIQGRKSAEAAFAASAEQSSRLLDESQLLEGSLQESARQILSTQEEERTRMSLQLHDDIAQTLLGIQVRLTALKKEAAANNMVLKQEIAVTQQLVEHSVRTIHRFARELCTPT